MKYPNPEISSKELVENLQIGKLILIKRINEEEKRDHLSIWNCRCLCGNETVAKAKLLISGKKKSCGCLRSENHHKLKHGYLKVGEELGEYQTWRRMIERCTKSPLSKPTQTKKNYIDRGIKVCERWLNSFENFYADIGPRPSKNHSLDRINNDGNYEPSNCRWATNKEQCNNRRSSRFICINGETKTLKQWSEKYGIKYSSLQTRLVAGWEIEDALKIPINSSAASEKAKLLRAQRGCAQQIPLERHPEG